MKSAAMRRFDIKPPRVTETLRKTNRFTFRWSDRLNEAASQA